MEALWTRMDFGLLLDTVVRWLASLFAALLLLVAFWIVYRATRPALSGILHRAGLDRALINMLVGVYRFTLLVFALIMAASQLGINVGAALAGLGVAGLTLGFAASSASPLRTRSATSWRDSSSSGTSRSGSATG